VTTFGAAVDRLINQVAHWEQPRWWSRLDDTGPTRGDVVYALVQRLADLGADAEHRERRPVPRIGDMSLPDQLRVMADDILAADVPEGTLRLAVEDINTIRRAL
jgi:hypothetical protein